MLTALDTYLATAPLGEAATASVLALLAVVFGSFAIGHAAEHVAAVRGGF